MKKILLGKKLSKKMIVLNFFIVLFIFTELLVGTMRLFIPWFPNYLSMYIFYIVIIVIVGFIAMNMLPCSYLEVTEDYLAFNEALKNKELFKEINAVMTSKHYLPSVYIQMDSLRAVQLNYQKVLIWALPTYLFTMKCLLSDGTIITITPRDIATNQGDYLKVITLLEECGVSVHDPYHLKVGLTKGAVHFQEYVKQLEKGDDTHD